MGFTTSPAWALPCQRPTSPPAATATIIDEQPCAAASPGAPAAFFSLPRLAGGGSGPRFKRSPWPAREGEEQRSRPQAAYALAEAGPSPQGATARGGPPKPERGLRVVKIAPDGKCMFRALARGMAHGQGVYLRAAEEARDADLLRKAVMEALCQGEAERKPYAEVAFSVEHVEGGFASYCSRLRDPAFWGGEAELVVLSKLLKVPITVYKTTAEAKRRGWGFVPIVELGAELSPSPGGTPEGPKGPKGQAAPRKPVKLLYVNGNHYDLLL